ncbi:class II aldolase/adducin N-terminal [Aspergillus oleicola]
MFISIAPELPQVQALGKTKSGKQFKIRIYPKFDNLEDERLHRKQHLAAVFRVLAHRGFDEGIAGHISADKPLSAHFSLIKVSDLVLVDEDGNIVEGDEPVNLPAFAIHSEIHKVRPAVKAAPKEYHEEAQNFVYILSKSYGL